MKPGINKTEKNLMTAFALESQARNLYSYFSKKAEKEGFRQIAGIFNEASEHVRVHAKRIYKAIPEGIIETDMKFTCTGIDSTEKNLTAAADMERFKWKEMYSSFSETAKQEGFEKIAELFDAIAAAKKHHENRFQALAENIKNNRVFKKDSSVTWHCMKCGYTHEGTEAPDVCPACAHPRAHFEVLAENY